MYQDSQFYVLGLPVLPIKTISFIYRYYESGYPGLSLKPSNTLCTGRKKDSKREGKKSKGQNTSVIICRFAALFLILQKELKLGIK